MSEVEAAQEAAELAAQAHEALVVAPARARAEEARRDLGWHEKELAAYREIVASGEFADVDMSYGTRARKRRVREARERLAAREAKLERAEAEREMSRRSVLGEPLNPA